MLGNVFSRSCGDHIEEALSYDTSTRISLGHDLRDTSRYSEMSVQKTSRRGKMKTSISRELALLNGKFHNQHDILRSRDRTILILDYGLDQ